jgi:hypothetical protein
VANKLLKFFRYAHLPVDLQDISKMFCDLAEQLDKNLGESAEKTTCMRKLLEAKDAGVRAYLEDHGFNGPTQ